MDQLDLKAIILDSAEIGHTTLTTQSDKCVVCGDTASGRHYGAKSCEGCKGFFKRSIRRKLAYSCRGNRDCEITKHQRNRCQYCRLQKCLQMGMHCNAVQHERKPLVLTNNSKRKNQQKGATQHQYQNTSLDYFTPSLFQLHRSSADYSEYTMHDSNLFPGDNNSESSATKQSADLTKAEEDITCAIEGKEATTNCLTLFSEIDLNEIVPKDDTDFSIVGHHGPSSLNACENASQLLFKSIFWARSLPAFQVLDFDMQVVITKFSWNELFAIGLVQSQDLLSLESVVSGSILLQQNSSNDRAHLITMADHLAKIQSFLRVALELNMDNYELAVLKALVLFSPDRVVEFGVPVINAVKELHSLIVNQLAEHVRSRKDDHFAHVTNMLLLLPQLRSVTSVSIEEVFFKNILGASSIDIVIPYILKMDPDPSNPVNNIGDGDTLSDETK